MKNLVFVLIFSCACVLPSQGKQPTRISGEFNGFIRAKTVFFDFVEKEEANSEFPYMEDQEVSFSVELDDITTMKVNSYIEVCLQPGDSIHIKVVYEGKNDKTVEFSGDPGAVLLNTQLYKMRRSRISNRYKANIPASLVTLVGAKDYYHNTLRQWEEEVALLDEIKEQISLQEYNYLISKIEGELLTNLIVYPEAISSFSRKNLEDCITDGYWNVLDNYKLRDDKASLRNRLYMEFLGIYKDYMRQKTAREKNEPYERPANLKAEYMDLVDFYKDSLRDVALFTYLYSSLAANQDYKEIESLTKDYFKKYNINKEYRKNLTKVMK